MNSRLARVQAVISSHPRLIVSLLVLFVFLVATGSAAAFDGSVGLDNVTLGNSSDVGTTGVGNVDGGPTDP